MALRGVMIEVAVGKVDVTVDLGMMMGMVDNDSLSTVMMIFFLYVCCCLDLKKTKNTHKKSLKKKMSRQPQDPYQNSNYRAAEYREPSFIDKLTMGALMGGTVGACAGFLIGGFTVLVYGPQPGGYLKTVAKYMASSGATFATIMGWVYLHIISYIH